MKTTTLKCNLFCSSHIIIETVSTSIELLITSKHMGYRVEWNFFVSLHFKFTLIVLTNLVSWLIVIMSQIILWLTFYIYKFYTCVFAKKRQTPERTSTLYEDLSPTANVTMYHFNYSKCPRDLSCWSRDILEYD
jgi:hypothetical protein